MANSRNVSYPIEIRRKVSGGRIVSAIANQTCGSCILRLVEGGVIVGYKSEEFPIWFVVAQGEDVKCPEILFTEVWYTNLKIATFIPPGITIPAYYNALLHGQSLRCEMLAKGLETQL